VREEGNKKADEKSSAFLLVPRAGKKSNFLGEDILSLL